MKKKPPNNKPPEPKTLRESGPILRGTVPFAIVKEVGELGDYGKKVVGFGYSGKMVGRADMPLASMLAQFIRRIAPMCHYKDRKAFNADLKLVKSVISRLDYTGK